MTRRWRGLIIALLVGACAAAWPWEAAARAPSDEGDAGAERVAQAEALLDELELAWADEDAEAVATIFDAEDDRSRSFRLQMSWYFERANYFEVSYDDVRLVPTDGGAVAGRALQTMKFNFVGDRIPQIRRTLLGLRFEPDDEGRLRITRMDNLPEPDLPVDNPVRAEHYDLDVRMEPEEHTVRVDGEVTLRNVSPREAGVVSLLLDGFTEDVEVTDLEGHALERLSLRAGVRLEELVLEDPLSPGEKTGLRFRYRLVRPQRSQQLLIQPDVVRLLEGLPWVPIFQFPADTQQPFFTYDLRIHVPKGWTALSAGRLVRHEREAGGEVFHWFTPFATGEVPVVAQKLRRVSLEAAAPEADPGPMALEIWVPEEVEGAGEHGHIQIERIADAYRFMADRFGAPPHPEARVVFADVPGLFSSAQLWILDRAWLDEIPAYSTDITRIHGHQAAHAWFVQGVEAGGPGSHFMREGPSELMALLHVREVWGEGAFLYRLNFHLEDLRFRAVPPFPLGLDQAPIPASAELARIKGSLVLNELRRWLGEDVLLAGLADYLSTHTAASASIWDFQAAISRAAAEAGIEPDLFVEPFFADFIFRNGLPDPQLVDGSSTPADQGGWNTTLVLVNEGDARVRVPLEVTTSTTETARRVLWMEQGSRREVEVWTESPVRRATIDPDRVLWQKDPRNDWWPGPPTSPDRGFGYQEIERDRMRRSLGPGRLR